MKLLITISKVCPLKLNSCYYIFSRLSSKLNRRYTINEGKAGARNSPKRAEPTAKTASKTNAQQAAPSPT